MQPRLEVVRVEGGGAAGGVADGAPLSGVRAVLLDYGGTLSQFQRPDRALERAYARIRGLLSQQGFAPPPVEALLRDVHDRVEAEFAAHCRSGSPEEIDLVAAASRAYADLGLRLSGEQLDDLLRIEQEAWWEGVTPTHDAVPALTALRDAGLRLVLCSNAPYRARSMHDQLEHVGLRRHLDAVTFSGEVGFRKPDPRMFEAALRAAGSTPAATVMVGDSEHDDIEGAKRLGMRAVLYRPGGVSVPARPTAADAVIERLLDLVGLLGLSLPILDAHA